jgi:hypothetical protein
MWPLYIVPPGLCLDDYRQTCLKCSLFALFISEMLGGRMSHRWFIAWVMDESLDESSHESWMSHRMSHGWVIAWVMDESSHESWMSHHMSDFDERSFARCSSHRIRHGMSHHVSDEVGNHLSGRHVIGIVIIWVTIWAIIWAIASMTIWTITWIMIWAIVCVPLWWNNDLMKLIWAADLYVIIMYYIWSLTIKSAFKAIIQLL